MMPVVCEVIGCLILCLFRCIYKIIKNQYFSYYIILFRGVLDTILRQMSPSHHNQPSEMFFPLYLEGLISFLDADLVYKNHHHVIAVCATYASQHLSFHNPSVVFIQKVVQGSFIFLFVLVIVWNLHVYYINRLKYVFHMVIWLS